ncbi:MAG: rhodanese-like domain-containing protein [Parvularculaceae bacterium]
MKKELLVGAATALALTGAAMAQDSFGGWQNMQQPMPPQQDPWGQQPPQGPNGGWGQPPQQQDQWGQQPPQNNGGWGQQPPANNGGWGQQPPQGPQRGGANLDQLMQMERQDYGVPATKQLHAGQMHGPTPASIPGGQVITTKGLVALVQGRQAPYMLFDVLGGPQTLPGAIPAVILAQPGSFNDQVSQQFGQMLQQAAGGRKDVPLIFYCLSTQCWMSYNAALRAINLGYTNVLWYRGGIEAWQQAGLPLQPAQQFSQQPPQQPNQQFPQQPPQQQGGWPNQ